MTKLQFIVYNLRRSTSVLSLIVENSKENIDDELFLKESFEAIAHEVQRLKELIAILSNIPNDCL